MPKNLVVDHRALIEMWRNSGNPDYGDCADDLEAAHEAAPKVEPALPAHEVNALPEHVRKYIMWLETNADPGHTLQDNFRLTEENAGLRAMLAEQPVAAQEAVAWSKTTPSTEGDYYVRGFNILAPKQYEALVQVRMHHFDGEPAPELVCNLHESTSSEDMNDWSPIVEMSDDFEWRGPLFAAPVAAAPVTVTRDADGEIVMVRQGDTIIASTCHAGGKPPAAPATDFPLTLRGLIAYGQVAADPSQGAVPNHMRDLIGQIVPHLKRLDEIESSAPAAPGIDLEQFREAVNYWFAKCSLTYDAVTVERIRNEASHLLRMIDATMQAQAGDAEVQS